MTLGKGFRVLPDNRHVSTEPKTLAGAFPTKEPREHQNDGSMRDLESKGHKHVPTTRRTVLEAYQPVLTGIHAVACKATPDTLPVSPRRVGVRAEGYAHKLRLLSQPAGVRNRARAAFRRPNNPGVSSLAGIIGRILLGIECRDLLETGGRFLLGGAA